MRRTRNMDRGSGMARQNISTGPLVTEHLRDIDLELELLKRKREMLEHQHNMFQPFQTQPQRSYNQQSYIYNDHGGQSTSNHDFSHLYDDGPQHIRKPFAKKRPSDSNWQHDFYPKKSAGRGHGYAASTQIRNYRPLNSPNPSKRGFPNKAGQGQQSIGQRIANQKQYISQENFVAKKINKPTKALAPPNKIASQSITERNQLVAVAMKSVVESEIRKGEECRLLPDREPTTQMRGRMEMSLGAILSNVREVYADSPHALTLGTVPLQRLIKQGIRDRIRTALLGKIVGTAKDIIKEYRDMFPKETDRDIVNEAIKTVGLESKEQPVNQIVSEIKPTTTQLVRPDDYFKENAIKLVNSHLHEMFNKIEEIYRHPDESESNIAHRDVTEGNAALNLENKATDMVQAVDHKDGDKSVVGNNEDVVKKDSDSLKKTAEAAKKEEDAAIKAEGEEAAAKLEISNPNIYKMMMPRLLKRYIPTIIRLLNINKMYREAITDLTAATRDKFVAYGNEKLIKENVQQSAAADVTPALTTTPKRSAQYPLPYYVKVMGKPQLPKKNLMQPFLEEFHPKSIKKHRSIHNLLFIGFTDKNYFDAIVAANGTIIGRSTLSIRICESSTDKQQNTTTPTVENTPNTTLVMSDQDTVLQKATSEDILGKDLDTQIDNLLTSIRQTEESCNENHDLCVENIKREISSIDGNETSTDTNIITTETTNEGSSETIKDEDIVKEEKLEMKPFENETSQKLLECMKTEMPFNSEISEISLESEQSENPLPNEKSEKPLESDQTEKPVESDQFEKSLESEHSEKPLESEQSEKPLESEQSEKPLESEKSEKSLESEKSKRPQGSNENDEKTDQLSALGAATAKSTPTRSSSRLANATPGRIQTRRASKLAQN